MTRRTLSILLVTTLSTPFVANAGADADAVTRLLAREEFAKARERCEKNDGSNPGSEAPLRDACARAYWPVAVTVNSVDGWAEYRKTWVGTVGEQPAVEREAKVALEQLRPEDASEGRLKTFIERYPDTKAASVAESHIPAAAIRDASTATEALRVARAYPEETGRSDLVQRFFMDFVEVEVDGDSASAQWKEGITFRPERPVKLAWGAQAPGNSLVPWDQYASEHLVGAGLDPEFVKAIHAERVTDGRAFPLCFDPDAAEGWTVGLRLWSNDAEGFVEVGFTEGCDHKSWPAFLVTRGGRIAALSLRPGWVLPIVAESTAGRTPWTSPGRESFDTSLYLPAAPGPLMVVAKAKVVGQTVSSLFLVYPLEGGMPWYTDKTPPEGTASFSGTITGAGLTGDWTVAPSGDGHKVHGAALRRLPVAMRDWTLPPGEAIGLSPLVQTVTNLHPGNRYVDPDPLPPLPGASDSAFWHHGRAALLAKAPEGTTEVEMLPLDARFISQALKQLTDGGIPAVSTRGWRLNLDEDPRQEVVIEASIGGTDVRILADPYPSGDVRTFVFDAVETGAHGSFDPFAFEHRGHRYIAWTGRADGKAYVDLVHFDARGLVKQHSEK